MLSQLATPRKPSTSTGIPFSASPPPSSTSSSTSSSSSSSHHLCLPGSFLPPSVQSPGGLQVSGQRTVPQGLPQSPEPPTTENGWDIGPRFFRSSFLFSYICDFDAAMIFERFRTSDQRGFSTYLQFLLMLSLALQSFPLVRPPSSYLCWL